MASKPKKAEIEEVEEEVAEGEAAMLRALPRLKELLAE